MKELLQNVWMNDEGQDIAEYAVMLAVILVIVVGTVRLIGTQANNVLSQTASAMGGEFSVGLVYFSAKYLRGRVCQPGVLEKVQCPFFRDLASEGPA